MDSSRTGRTAAALLRAPAATLGAALLLMLALAAVVALRPAGGADHTDAPGISGDRAADITDVYAFRSPERPDNLVVALNVNPLTAPADNTGSVFPSGVSYAIHVDNSGDLVADATVAVTFSGNRYTVTGLGDPITGDVTPPSLAGTAPAPIVAEAGGIRLFAGQRDDPFFFDFVGFTGFIEAPFTPAAGLRPAGETPADTFAGTNVSSIVLELPITALTGAAGSDTGVIRAWASTSRGGQQIDRMAIPAINTVLIPSGQKNAFNAAQPVNDVADYLATGQATIEALRAAVVPALGPESSGPLGNLTAEQVAGALIPDVVTIDFAQPVQFPNGRRLTDDVTDIAVGLVLNRGGAAGISDAVNGNDRAFSGSFPYLAAPHQPTGLVTPPAAGQAGLAEGGGPGGTLAIAAVGALALVVAGGALALRRRGSAA